MTISPPAPRRIGVAAISALACAAMLMPSSASAAPPPSASAGAAAGNVTAAAWAAGRAEHGRGASAQQALEAYWTPERMRGAVPAEELPEFKAAIAKHDRDSAAKQAGRRQGRPRAPGA